MAGPLLLLGLLACVFTPASFQSRAPIVVISEVCYYPVDLDSVERQLKEDNVSISIMSMEGKCYTFLLEVFVLVQNLGEEGKYTILNLCASYGCLV